MNNKDILGYSDGSPYSSEPFIDINTPNGLIDMSNTGRPILANGVELAPYSGLHDMGTTNVREIPLDKFQGPLRLGEVGRRLTNFFKPKNIFNFSKTPNLTPMLTNKSYTRFGDPGDVRQYDFADWQNYVTDVNNLQRPALPYSPVQTRSLSIGNALVNNTDKAGNIKMSTLQNFADNLDRKVSGAQVEADKLLIQSTIDGLKITNPSLTDKSKIPYSLFESQVNQNIIQFEPKLTNKYANVGLDKLGYKTSEGMLDEFSKKHVDINKTILWQNDQIGNPNNDFHFPTNDHGPTYGHTRFFATDKKLFNILELQSDEFQRPLLTKLKKADERIISAQNKKKEKQNLIDNWSADENSIIPPNQQWSNYKSQANEEIKYLDDQIKNAEYDRDQIGGLISTRSANTNKQINALEKNHMSRMFAETVKYAADNGFQTVRYPHQKTVAVVEGFEPSIEDKDVLVNPWTRSNIADFDVAINELSAGNTYGHTKVAKQHGPFVHIPDEVNSIYSMDNNPRITHEVEGWAPKKATKPRSDLYKNDKAYREELYKQGWTDEEIAEYTANVGHWKNNFISLDNDGRYTITVRNTTQPDQTAPGWASPRVDIPEETAKNLQGGLYHIQEDGSWLYVGKDKDAVTKYTQDIREINHKRIEQPERPVFNIDDYGGVKYKKDKNKFLKDGVTENPNYNKRAKNSKGEPTMEREWSDQQSILRKYNEKDFKKYLKSTFGKDATYRVVYDEEGYAWYEFDLPVGWKAGEAQIKAYKQGGEIGGYRLSKFNDGGGIDYSDAEQVTINGQTYYRHKVKPNQGKGEISSKYGIWNQEAVLNSINSKFTDIKDQPNYSKMVNRMWEGDYVLVGGPEFEPHVEYTEDRGSYANSFENIPQEELWSAITAIGHIETGSKVKYKRPEGRKYKNTTDDPQYLADNHPFTGIYESGMDNAYGFVSSANALGRFGIKEVLVDKYAKDILGYKEGEDWRGQYLKNKEDQRKLMKHLITQVYPDELVQIRHFHPEASAQYSDFELLAAIHKGGQGNVKKQLSEGQFSEQAVVGDISMGGYTKRIMNYLDPNLDISNSSFFMKNNPAHDFFKNKPKYKFGGSTNKEEIRNEIIADMLDNGAFLPKFEQGSEKNIEGVLGNYRINKSYDKKRQLPFVEYNRNSESLENNRIYYDKDDTGYDNFNIIDVYTQEDDQKKRHNRIKNIIYKYDQGLQLNPIELETMRELGLLDNQPRKQKTVEQVVVEPVKSGVDIPLEDINASKDLYNKTDGNNKGISLKHQISIYSKLINGIFDKDEKLKKVKRVYDRLNSLYYNDAKASKMTVLDYMKSLNN